jgi:hypothetical protein
MRVLTAAVATLAIGVSSSLAQTNGNFPEKAPPPGCAVLAENPAAVGNPPEMPDTAGNPPNPRSGLDGSDNGFFNKFDLFTDACLGG